MTGNVFLINGEVRQENGNMDVPGEDVLALVDADGKSCTTPDQRILDTPNLRVFLTSSPRSREDRKWLTQSVQDSVAAFITEPWSRDELLVTSFVHSAGEIGPLIFPI